MTIEEMQKAIHAKGYQWTERIYNDDLESNPLKIPWHDCSLAFTLSKNPIYFCDNRVGDCGWGRLPRHTAWSHAYQALVVEGRNYQPKETDNVEKS